MVVCSQFQIFHADLVIGYLLSLLFLYFVLYFLFFMFRSRTCLFVASTFLFPLCLSLHFARSHRSECSISSM